MTSTTTHRFVERSALRPGQMFVLAYPILGAFGLRRPTDVLIVIDKTTEIGFWRGGKCCLGDVEPSALVEVVS